MTIKNYKVMCKLLCEKEKSGSSRESQHKEWDRYFGYTKQGFKYIVTEVYNTPKEKVDGRSKGNGTTHGLSKTKLYKVRRGMITRCECESSPLYPYYGGRGIKICDEWRKSVTAFYEWAIANGYEEDKGLSIDRIDVNGNYEPSNCRWVDDKIQAINRRISQGKIINSSKRKKEYIIQNVDGMYLTYLIISTRTFPVGTYFSEEEAMQNINILYEKLLKIL